MSRLNKELGLLQGIALLSTSLLGTGIFVVPALAATAAGAASLWAWMILIALVLPVAFTFAQLGKRFPHAGGAPQLRAEAEPRYADFGLMAADEAVHALGFDAKAVVDLPLDQRKVEVEPAVVEPAALRTGIAFIAPATA